MKRSLAAAAALSLLAAAEARAQTTAPVSLHTFAAVDAVEVDVANLLVTGVLQGEQAPTTRQFNLPKSGSSTSYDDAYVATCHRLALLAMSKPGAYLFQVSYPYPSSFPRCKLIRATP